MSRLRSRRHYINSRGGACAPSHDERSASSYSTSAALHSQPLSIARTRDLLRAEHRCASSLSHSLCGPQWGRRPSHRRMPAPAPGVAEISAPDRRVNSAGPAPALDPGITTPRTSIPKSKPGWRPIPASTCTSLPRALPGLTWWNAFSAISPPNDYGAASSTASPNWSPHCRTTSHTTIKLPRPLSGPHKPPISS